ncbi:MAG: oligosaccharide flippase family protein [Flavobacteriales bacterium]
MKERSFYSNLFFSLGLNLLVKPAAIFIIDAAVQNEVGPQYGFYFAIFNLSLILSILFDFGVNNLSTKLAAQNIDAAKQQFSSIFIFRFGLMLFYVGGLSCINLYLKLSWNDYKLILLLGLNQFLIANIAYFRSFFAGMHWFRLDAFFSVLDRLLLIFSMGYILYIYPDGFKLVDIQMYASLQFAGYLLTFLWAGLMLFKSIRPPLQLPNWKLIKTLVTTAFPYALLIVLMMLYTRSDAILLGWLAGIEHASYYAQAFRLIDALYMFAMVFAGLLLPMFARSLHRASHNDIQLLTQQASKLLLGASIVFIVFVFFHGSSFLDIIYPQSRVWLSDILLLLSFAFFGLASNLIYGSLLTANGSLKLLNIISAIGVLINIGLNIWLINEYHQFQAGFSAMVAALTQLLMAGVQRYYCYKLFNIQFSSKLFLQFAMLFFVLTGWYLIVAFSPIGYSLSRGTLIILDVIASFCIMALLRFIDIKELLKLLQNRDAMK